MFSLTRKQFPDVHLTREDLDALTDLWLAWHEQARSRFLERASYQRLRPLWRTGQRQGIRSNTPPFSAW